MPDTRPPVPSPVAPIDDEETPRQFLKRRPLPKPWIHARVRNAFTRRGFVVKSVERKADDPIWGVVLNPGTVAGCDDYKAVRREVSKALLDLGLRCRPSALGAMVSGKRITAGFVWDRGEPGYARFVPDSSIPADFLKYTKTPETVI